MGLSAPPWTWPKLARSSVSAAVRLTRPFTLRMPKSTNILFSGPYALRYSFPWSPPLQAVTCSDDLLEKLESLTKNTSPDPVSPPGPLDEDRLWLDWLLS